MPSNADIFQTSFLNGLSMATAQESGKLAAMQQAAQLQYGLQSKQLDFQLSLLKMRESQAAQAVELRMAQDEHQLRLKDYALRAEESKMRGEQLSMEMETKKVATAAGVAISGLENRLAQAGVDPSSPEFLLAQVSAVRQGVLSGVDERVRNMVGSTLNAKLRTTQEALYNDGLAAFDKLNASRTVTLDNAEAGLAMTDKMFGVADRGKLIAVADRFRQAALLGHEPSQRMYGEVMALVEGVGATAKPGVTPAASEAERARAAAGLGEARAIATQAAGPMSDEEYKRAFLSARTSTKQTNANRALDAASQKLIDLETRFGQADDLQAALGVKRLRDQLEGARRATIAGLQGRAAVDRASLVQSLTQDEVAQIAAATTEAEVLRLAAKFGARQIPAPEDNVSGFMTLY